MHSDSAPYTWVPGGRRDLLVICDHARASIPAAYHDLGLGAEALARHIAYDLGALGVARRLARALDAPLIAHRYSRLLIDPNRAPGDPTLILERSDGTEVPGNRALSVAERAARLARFHTPYHAAIAARLDRLQAVGIRPLLVSIHSFTPVLSGQPRPWEVGLVWQRDTTLARRAIAVLRALGVRVGDNQPYDGHHAMGYTLEHHGRDRALPHLMFELRQDLLDRAVAQRRWAECVLEAVRAVMFDLGCAPPPA